MFFIQFRATCMSNQSAIKSAIKQAPEEGYLFVEQPSDDFFCPVTTGLLLQPHLTSCCGKHLSQEAAIRIQEERGACPLCKTPQWSSMLNKHFQHQVNGQRVFCRHDDRGCGWQGELGDLEHHVQSCPMRDGPEQLKLPLYVNYCISSAHVTIHLHTLYTHQRPPTSQSLINSCTTFHTSHQARTGKAFLLVQ